MTMTSFQRMRRDLDTAGASASGAAAAACLGPGSCVSTDLLARIFVYFIRHRVINRLNIETAQSILRD